MGQITKGEWKYDHDAVVDVNGNIIASLSKDKKQYFKERNETLSNAKLIAEAGTVANETGMTPKEMQSQLIGLKAAAIMLQEQNKELLEALKYAKRFLNDSADKEYIESAINKAQS